MIKNTAILVTTCDRPAALDRSLKQIKELGAPVLVVDDSRTTGGRDSSRDVAGFYCVEYLRLPSNRGLACAINVGAHYWLADHDVEWLSYFQDDVDVDPDLLKVMATLQNQATTPILSGRDAKEHTSFATKIVKGVQVQMKKSSSGVHLHAHRMYWAGVLPIPTIALGAPKSVPGKERGMGSNADWWITRHSPKSAGATGGSIMCVPGLVRTFLVHAKDSSWGNEHKGGEDAPLSREAIRNWEAPL